MNEDKDNIFKIDKKYMDIVIYPSIEFIKKQYKFFFGFFLGVVVIVFLT